MGSRKSIENTSCKQSIAATIDHRPPWPKTQRSFESDLTRKLKLDKMCLL